MSKRARQYIGLCLAILSYYIIHEGAHLMYALKLGVFKKINFIGLGVQIDVFAEKMTENQLGIFCIIGSVTTMITAYMLVAFADKIGKISSKIFKASMYYITIAMLLIDPLYLSIFCSFFGGGDMNGISLKPELMVLAAEWFHSKWRVPTEAYLECMEAYLQGETEYGWYLCLDGNQIVGGLGVIENDFHDRKDLTPNICAVYTEDTYRCRGIAGRLLNMAVEDLRLKGVSPVYLITDHTGFDILYVEDLEEYNKQYLKYTSQVAENCQDRDLSNDSMVIGTSAIIDTEIDGAVGMNSGIFNNPFIIWGRYKKKWFRYYLTLSFQFHHTQMDGAHAGRFLANLQKEINNLK